MKETMDVVVRIMQHVVGSITERQMAKVFASTVTAAERVSASHDSTVTLYRLTPIGCDPTDRVTLTAVSPISAFPVRSMVSRAHHYGDVVVLTVETQEFPSDLALPTKISTETYDCVNAREAEECEKPILDALAYVGLDLRGG